MDGEGPELRVQLTRRADGTSVLRCVRADGSATWQRHRGERAAFFPFHDLVHFAVETVLGFRHGFYGLLADGWDVEETGGKGPRGRLPDEALLVEHLVGLFSPTRATGQPLPASEVNALVQGWAAESRFRAARTVTDAELAAVHARIAELHRAWRGTPAEGTMELAFDRRQPA